MNKKGFTLIELVGTILILSLVVLIAIPAISRSLNKGVNNVDEQLKRNIELAAENWASDNKNQLPTTQNGTKTVSTATLKADGYLNGNIIKPSANQIIQNSCVTIKKTNATNAAKSAYKYTFKESC